MADLEGILYGVRHEQNGGAKAVEVYRKAKFWPYLEDRSKTLKMLHDFIFMFTRTCVLLSPSGVHLLMSRSSEGGRVVEADVSHFRALCWTKTDGDLVVCL